MTPYRKKILQNINKTIDESGKIKGLKNQIVELEKTIENMKTENEALKMQIEFDKYVSRGQSLRSSLRSQNKQGQDGQRSGSKE